MVFKRKLIYIKYSCNEILENISLFQFCHYICGVYNYSVCYHESWRE